MFEQSLDFLFCEKYSTFRQPNFDHVASPPSKTDSTSIPSAGGSFGKYKTLGHSPGRGAKYGDILLSDIADKHHGVAFSYVSPPAVTSLKRGDREPVKETLPEREKGQTRSEYLLGE